MLWAHQEQQIVDSVEVEQHQVNHTTIHADGAAQHLKLQQSKEIIHTTDDGWLIAATENRRDSFSRTRKEDAEDEPAEDGDDEDSVVTQIRIEEDVLMAD